MHSQVLSRQPDQTLASFASRRADMDVLGMLVIESSLKCSTHWSAVEKDLLARFHYCDKYLIETKGRKIILVCSQEFSAQSSNHCFGSEVRQNVMVGACIGSRMKQEGNWGPNRTFKGTYLVTHLLKAHSFVSSCVNQFTNEINTLTIQSPVVIGCTCWGPNFQHREPSDGHFVYLQHVDCRIRNLGVTRFGLEASPTPPPVDSKLYIGFFGSHRRLYQQSFLEWLIWLMESEHWRREQIR